MDAPGGRQSIEEFIGTAQKQDDGASGFIVTSAASAVATNGVCAGERPGRHDEPVEKEDRSAELLLRLQDPALRAYGQDRDGGYSLGDHPGQLDIAALRRSLSGRPKLKRVCHICGRECPSRHKLQRHLSTHSQDRPYNCRVCGKAFKWTEYLAKHMRTQHAQGNNSTSANNSNVLRNFSTAAVQSNAASRDELGNRANSNGELNSQSPTCQLGRGQQQQQQPHQHCSRHSSATNTTFAEAGQNTRPYSLGDEVTSNHQSTQDYYTTSSNGVSKANAAVTADFGSSLPQPIHQSTTEDTSSLLYNPTSSYTSPAITDTVPLSHPDFNQVPTTHSTFSPAATTDPIPSSKCSDGLCQAMSQQHELERPLSNGLPVTYPATSGYTQPPPLISVPTTANQSHNCHHSSTMAPPCAYHMNSQTDSTSKSTSVQYLNPLPLKAGSLQQRRAPIRIINLTRKKDVGVQCEVGHETLQALFEEENAAHRRDTMTSCDSISSDVLAPDDDLSGSVFDPSDSICKFPCEYDSCERSYVHRKDLVRHMKVAHKISPKLLEPQVIESPAKPNVCSVGSCGKSYYHLKDLRRHQRQCHSVTVAAVSPRPEEVWESGGSLRYPCDYSGCTKSYIHKKDLVRHKRMFHSDSSTHPTVPEPVVVVTTKRKESTDSNSGSVSSPEQPTGRRKRFRLDSSAEPQSSPNLPISSLQPGHSLEADLAALSASNIMDNLNVVAGIVGMGLPASLFNIPTTLGGGQTSASILTADGDVQQLINTLPSAFSCNSIVPGDAATTDDMVGTSNYPNSHLVSFPDSSSTTTSLLAQYSPMQETFTDDNSTHTTSVVSAGILSHVS